MLIGFICLFAGEDGMKAIRNMSLNTVSNKSKRLRKVSEFERSLTLPGFEMADAAVLLPQISIFISFHMHS